MEEIPEFWRTEVFHPLSVHFPIALLITAFVFKLIAIKFHKEVWHLGGSILLISGTVGVWIAIYTGNLADGIVSRQICDPTILKEHQNMAYLTAWIFTASGVIDLSLFWKNSILYQKRRLIKISNVLLLAVASTVLIYVGHLGATLVYQQGAGVYRTSADCGEFVD